MTKWKTVKLGEVFDLQMGKTPFRRVFKYWNNGDYDWVSIADLSSFHKYVSKTKETISETGVLESGIRPVPAHTVIMSFKLSLGKTAITVNDVFTNEAIMAFIERNKPQYDVNYLYYLLSNMDWSKGTNRAVMGITLNKSIIKEIEIPLPPLEEQRRIADILDKATRLIDLKKQQLKNLTQLTKSKFLEMFGDPVMNTKEWSTVPLKNLSVKIGSGATPRGGSTSYITKGTSLIRSMHVYNGFFDYDGLAHINEEQAKQLEGVTVEKDDVLLNITGASVARCCIVPENVLPARVNQHVCIIRCDDEQILPAFLNHLLISDQFQSLLWSKAEIGGATRQALTKQQIEKLTIIHPPLERQSIFETIIDINNKTKNTIMLTINKLEAFYKSLTQTFFE